MGCCLGTLCLPVPFVEQFEPRSCQTFVESALDPNRLIVYSDVIPERCSENADFEKRNHQTTKTMSMQSVNRQYLQAQRMQLTYYETIIISIN